MTTKHARFCYNNWLSSTSCQASSALSNFPSSNLYGTFRSKSWKAEGSFEISASNNKVYINSTTYTVPVGTYTVTTLITAFNTATSQTLSRNSLGRFVITLGSSGTLNLSSTTNAIWDTLGYLSTTDQTGTAFTADERRYNTGEWILVDNGVPQIPHFACLIPEAETVFSAPTATIRFQGNNTLNWTAPVYDQAMEVSSKGAFHCPDEDSVPCRYWRIFIDDVKNSAISVSKCYIGDSFIPQNTNISQGFSIGFEDPSIRLQSESGQLYMDRRTRQTVISSLQVQLAKDTDRYEIEQLLYDLGIGRPFFLVIDPKVQVSSAISDMTYYVYVDQSPNFQHVFRGYYNMSIQLREAV